jgi:hypothetical protein
MAIGPPADPSESSPRSLLRDRTLRNLLAGVLVLAVILRLALIFTTHATEEDFYITLRYAQNLAHGAGFVYNPGEHVLGTTTPLYTLLLALSIRLNLDPTLTGKLACAGADAVSCWFIWRLSCTLGRPTAGLCAALCFAIAPLNLTESVKGMEASLVACTGIMAFALWAEGRTGPAWFCVGLATLLRIDGVALALVLLAASILRDRRPPWKGLRILALVTLPWLAFTTIAFGSPIPTSLRAKLIVYSWRNPGAFPNIVPFLRIMTHNGLGAFLFAGALITLATEAWRLLRAGTRAASGTRRGGPVIPAMLAWLLLYYGGMALSKVFLFGWYFLPPTPVYYLVAFLGWRRVAMANKRLLPEWARRRRTLPILAAAALAAGTLLAVVIVPRAARGLRDSQRAEDALRIPIGLWLREHAAPQETVMLEPIGYIGYYSGLRVLDTVGLVSPQVLPFYREDEPSPYHRLWTSFLPEWVLLRAGEWQALQRYEQTLPAGARLEARYRLANTWRAPGSRPDAQPAFFLFRRIEN